MQSRTYDLVVIGTGGGGVAAAIEASRLGKSVALVDRGPLGGTCTNTGCVPSKALLAAAAARHTAADAGRFPGIQASAGAVSAGALADGKQALVDSMRAARYEDLVAAYGWDLFRGDATFTGSPEDPALDVSFPDGTHVAVNGRHYVVATGSAPWVPAIPGLAESGYLTSATAMELRELPESVIVVGGGFVAVELAQLFARLGTDVTVLARSKLVSAEEPEASKALQDALAAEGIRTVRRAVPVAVSRDAAGNAAVTAEVAGKRMQFVGSDVLMATGRRPVTAGLGLAAIRVEVGPRDEIVVDSHQGTANPRVWAAGDVTGGPAFVYVAAAQGALAARNAMTAGDAAPQGVLDMAALPRVAFTSPAVGVAGMTEREAQRAGFASECRVLPMDLVPRAIVDRDTRGFVKVIAEIGTGRILGVTAVAREAGEMAAAAVQIIATGTTVDELAHRWAPYLTVSEGLRLAAQSFTQDVNLLSCCAA